MAVDEVLFQIETDKVTIDVRAPESGVLEDVMVGALDMHACMHAGRQAGRQRTCSILMERCVLCR